MSLFPNQNPDSIAFYMEEGSWSYRQLQESAEEIAASIGGRTLVFLLCTNTPESIAAYVGCLNHGIVPAMIDGEIDGELLAQLRESYHPSHILLPKERRGEFPGSEEKYSLGGYVLLAAREHNAPALHPDLALLMTTSGSTGSPKFVRLSYENIRANTESIIEYLGIDEHERAITNLPMHYVYGLSIINI
ncbi:MAG: AMP-binding protein, partial [Selenomonadaceae bacterium]|nr:AMP-binding protein [Selenomonadaceae bacterium]